MTDLTKITTPFGLLDEETQADLKAHGGPYEAWMGHWGWVDKELDVGVKRNVYRVKPAPPKPREWWVTGGNCLWCDRHEAMRNCATNEFPVHVREVLP